MPVYVYKCKECGESTDVARRMAECDDPVNCGSCGSREMARNFKAEGAPGGAREYAGTKWSQSLAISPTQIAEHRRLFPDVRVRSDGCVGFDNYQQHDSYLKKTGFVKQPAKSKRKSK